MSSLIRETYVREAMLLQGRMKDAVIRELFPDPWDLLFIADRVRLHEHPNAAEPRLDVILDGQLAATISYISTVTEEEDRTIFKHTVKVRYPSKQRPVD